MDPTAEEIQDLMASALEALDRVRVEKRNHSGFQNRQNRSRPNRSENCHLVWRKTAVAGALSWPLVFGETLALKKLISARQGGVG
jgi:hypothetical protein